MRPFFEWLTASVARNDSLLCVGLDPDPDRLGGEDLLAFNRRIIDATADVVCCYKPNSAFYEALGPAGLDALCQTIDYIHTRGLPVILDAKRSDIGSTAAAYARAVFEVYGADAVTVNPYLGADSVAPFTQYRDKGVFVLCHTSNPGARDFQELDAGGRPLYLVVLEHVRRWNLDSPNLGLVVGATYPDELRAVRALAPDLWLLVPGIGTQGGDLEAAVTAGLKSDNTGLIVNVSRAVLYAPDPRAAARTFRDRINDTRSKGRWKVGKLKVESYEPSTLQPSTLQPSTLQPSTFQPSTALILALYDLGAVQFGDFTLHSGRKSPIYIDLRLLVSDPAVMRQVTQAYVQILRNLSFDRLAAIPYAALPIGTAVSLALGRPLIYPRKEIKEHGTKRAIEGRYNPGESVVVLDDLITTGGSKLEAIAPLEAAGLHVSDIVVLIDREQGGREALAERGYRLHSALKLSEIAATLHGLGRIGDAEHDAVQALIGL